MKWGLVPVHYRVCLAAGSKTKEGAAANAAQEPEAAGWMEVKSSCIMKIKDAARAILHHGLSPSHLHLCAAQPPSLLCFPILHPPGPPFTLTSCSHRSLWSTVALRLEPPSAWAFKSCDLAATDWSGPPRLTNYFAFVWQIRIVPTITS